MKLGMKLKNYFEEKGLRIDKFAERLGLSKMQMYQVVGDRAGVPKRCWKKLIELTEGEISLADILEMHFEEMEDIEVKRIDNIHKVEVSLRDFNKRHKLKN